MFCEKCGKQLKDGVKFCSGCGAPQTVQQSNFGQPTYGAQPSYNGQTDVNYGAQPSYNAQPDYGYGAQPAYAAPKKKGHGGLVALIIVLILVGACVGSYFIFPTPEKAARKCMEAMLELDFKEAAKYMDSKSASLINVAVEFGEDDIDDLGDELRDEFDSIKIEDVEVDYGDDGNPVTNVFNKYFAEDCTVYITMSYLGEEDVEAVSMINEGFGNWKVDGEAFADFF